MINQFESYEAQMSYFVHATNLTLLPMTEGRSQFFRQLGNWFINQGHGKVFDHVAYILPNPSQGMSFPTAQDVLSTVLTMYLEPCKVDDEAKRLLTEFGLSLSKASQPIVSLSGGELLLLSFAKAKAMLPTVNRLVACSPVHWLNQAKYKYWDILASRYIEENKSVDVALLSGEPFPNRNDTNEPDESIQTTPKPIRWKININEPKVVFPEVAFPTHHPESSLQYICSEPTIYLESPTLVTGDNGVGKSIFAKTLAGVIKPTTGSVSVLCMNGIGNARLIFQDSIDQIFGMSIDSHMDWVFRFDGDKSKQAKSIYTSMESSIRRSLHESEFEGLAALGMAGNRATLLQSKICLVAERIASSPPLIIMDEPGWGLSRKVSRLFIMETCKQAHDAGIAIVIISHQPGWWNGIVRSHVQLQKASDATVTIKATGESL